MHARVFKRMGSRVVEAVFVARLSDDVDDDETNVNRCARETGSVLCAQGLSGYTFQLFDTQKWI